MEESQKPAPQSQNQDTATPKETAPKSLKPATPNKIVKYIAPVGVVAVTLVLAGLLIVNKDAIKKSATTAESQDTQVAGADVATNTTGNEAPANIKDVKLDSGPYIGDANAPVAIAYWSDFQCPYCKQFELATMPAILQNYVNKGKVKIVFKDFQFLGNDSLTAALYARAIWELYPGEYFPWREALYNKQDAENGGFGDETSIKTLTASIVGIDVTKVANQVANKSGEYQAAITADRAEGANMGITGTPGFITGTQRISGAATASAFSAAIDPQLK